MALCKIKLVRNVSDYHHFRRQQNTHLTVASYDNLCWYTHALETKLTIKPVIIVL